MLMIAAQEQPQKKTTAGSTDSVQEGREPLATFVAFVHTRMPTSAFLVLPNGGPIILRASTQTRLHSYQTQTRTRAIHTVEAEMMAFGCQIKKAAGGLP